MRVFIITLLFISLQAFSYTGKLPSVPSVPSIDTTFGAVVEEEKPKTVKKDEYKWKDETFFLRIINGKVIQARNINHARDEFGRLHIAVPVHGVYEYYTNRSIIGNKTLIVKVKDKNHTASGMLKANAKDDISFRASDVTFEMRRLKDGN